MSRARIERIMSYDLHDPEDGVVPLVFNMCERLGYLNTGKRALRSAKDREIDPDDSLVTSLLVEMGVNSIAREINFFLDPENRVIERFPGVYAYLRDNIDELEAMLVEHEAEEAEEAFEYIKENVYNRKPFDPEEKMQKLKDDRLEALRKIRISGIKSGLEWQEFVLAA